MDELIKKLRSEAGLTEKQANEALYIIVKYMEEKYPGIKWENAFKEKYSEFREKTDAFIDKLGYQAKEYKDKTKDEVEEIAETTRKKLHDTAQKAADFLDDDKKD